ncbi:GPO family capsid scaffolding protein [Marinobacter nanhaiticus D15-8W]|uniref:Phage capsid protein n=1 Tax=Marinobacter nanhaiticus D15-8W TaxID=626887 RepID=N6WU88_9GAMM|nr:GPO family capsid scaffolding protein [Marinobacter nanhaiticus]ENO14597.1 phage capsid protein [Marinobacter nanhaiticus D15-8W]BES69718.1 GPO family capsid scaffolding protein [Marinobacter nanhaiticus D15-8W]BES69763.1 GPO family capsid scaffolding protein [Marinobacter nanhaiticus D15-8W]
MPKKTALYTDWIVIGTAGPTIDGRNISDTLLEQAASNYDPSEYTAVINSDHLLGLYGNFGSVVELQTARDEKDRTVLQARLAPNKRLLQMNAEGQRLFTSMELIEDFVGTGEGYLIGLAVTDQPASIGTTELHFSKSSSVVPSLLGESTELSLETPATDDSLFQRFMRAFVNSSHATGAVADDANENPTEDDEMTQQQYDALMQKLQALSAKVNPEQGETADTTVTAEQFNTLTEQVEALGAKIEQLAGGGESAEPGASEGVDQFAQITDAVKGLAAKFDALLQERPDGRKPAGTGANEAQGFV